jgi:hypothetical protein
VLVFKKPGVKLSFYPFACLILLHTPAEAHTARTSKAAACEMITSLGRGKHVSSVNRGGARPPKGRQRRMPA